MSDIVFNAWGVQNKIIKDNNRIIGAFAGKRCIIPESKVLTLDGIKEFGDIDSLSGILSFDQKANQFRFSQSGSSFPKTRATGYRVIHERGEFVASGHHQIFCADYKYRSVGEIFDKLGLGSTELEQTFLCPNYSIEELSQLLSLLSVENLNQRLLGSQKNYENEYRQYDQRLQLMLKDAQVLFQQTNDAQDIKQSAFYHEFCGIDGNQKAQILRHIRHGLAYVQNPTLDVEDLEAYLSAYGLGRLTYERILLQLQDLCLEFLPQQSSFYAHDKAQGLNYKLQDLDVLPSYSRILAIEAESSPRWFWDVEVPGDNNYVSGGAIHHNSGKTEVGAIKSILWQEEKSNYRKNDVDPFLGVIIAPTFDMLRRLSMKKFTLYAKPFIRDFNKSIMEVTWHDGSQIYGLSADNPERIEGIKAHWVWLDEVFQMSEQLWLEVRARTADTQGKILATGSLGVQFVNPKQHWVHKYFKESPGHNVSCYEWATAKNPHFPKEEIEDLKNVLDPATYRSMFEIDWDTTPRAAVYAEFSEHNIVDNYLYNPKFETYVAVDWGWAHPMACLFFQYDRAKDTVYVFDEIVESNLKLEQLYARIMAKKYKIKGWVCDIAGTQEREQSGISNTRFFRNNYQIEFIHKRSAIAVGVSLVRSYIRSASGQTRLYVANSCKKTIDGFKRYSYPERDGQIQNENPVKKDDDAMDALRYFFINIVAKKEVGSIESLRVF